MTATETLPKLLDIEQRADHLGISSGYVRRLIAERRAVSHSGGYVRFDPDEIAAWLDRRKDRHSGASPATPPYHESESLSLTANRVTVNEVP
jgi:hypothetical protein